MGRIDENYFKPGKNEYNSISDIIDRENDEQILWNGRPKKKAFILNSCIKMFPIALLWIAFDGFFIGMISRNFSSIPSGMIIFFIIFFLFHLMPVWIWISNVITSNRKYKNLEYAFTNKRIIIKSGIIGIDFKSIYYSEISSVNLKIGFIDKMLHVGDIYITSVGAADILFDLENPHFIAERLQKIVVDIKTDISFPNNLRPNQNDGYHTNYRP